MAKIGLIVEGGGMKCAYSAGILDAFLDDGIRFDYCIGVSAGSGNVASYLAGQRGRNLRFYTEHIHEPGYFGLRSFLQTGDLFGLEYIYGTLTNTGGGDPLDYDKMQANPAEFVIVSTDAYTGKPVYFRKEDMPKNDYRMVMASCCLPSVCRPVRIGSGRYFDGGVSNSLPVEKALEDGCDRTVLLMSKPDDYVKTPEKYKAFYSLSLLRYPNVIKALDRRHLMYNGQRERVRQLEKEGKVFVLAPSRHLAMGTYAMDAKANQALYDLGIEDYHEKKEALLAYMQGA